MSRERFIDACYAVIGWAGIVFIAWLAAQGV